MPQIKKNAPIAARPELRCEEVVFIVEFSLNLSFGSRPISGRKPHTNNFLRQVRPDMLSVGDDATIAAEGTKKQSF
jgi:hypothetical protein